jgi:hypothetical protein
MCMYLISPLKGVDLNDLQSELIIRDYTILLQKKSAVKVLFSTAKLHNLYRVDSKLKSIHDFLTQFYHYNLGLQIKI